MRLLILFAFVVFGQQSKPDFNGTWVLNRVKSEKAIREGLSAVEGLMTIKVTEKDVTFVGTGFGEQKVVCVFGPTPVVNIDPMNLAYCAAKWDGEQLMTTVTERTYPLALKGTRTRRSTTYVVTGSELKLTGVLPRVNGGDPFTLTLFWDRAK